MATIPAQRSIIHRRLQLGSELEAPTRIWQPPGGLAAPTTDGVRRGKTPSAPLPERVEAQIATVLARPLSPGESHLRGQERRERELRELFAKLPALQRYTLRQRLERDVDADALAVAFRRLVIDRRLRLLAVLALRR
jgi:hypothetical protein